MSADQFKARASWLSALVRFYALVVIALATAFMMAIVVIMGIQVFCRYVLNDSLIWAEEICRYLLVLMTFLLIGAAFERGEMVCLQFLTGRLPVRGRLAVLLLMHVAMTGFLLTLSVYGYQFATLNSHFTVPAIDFIGTSLLGREVNLVLSMYWMYMLVPVACIILCGHFIVAIVRMALGLLGLVDPTEVLPPGHKVTATDWIG